MSRAGASGDPGEGWRVDVHRTDAALEELAGDWEALVARCPAATPFQSHAWLAGWWRQYGRRGALRLAAVHRGGQLVALGAFHLVRRGVPVLAPLGEGLSDWTDVLVDPEYAPGALDALAGALVAEPGWAVLDLPEVRAASTGALQLADRWPGAVHRTSGSVCADLVARPLDDVVAAMSSASARRNVRGALRKIDAAGVVETDLEPATVPDGLRHLIALHQEQWRERGGMTPEHGRPRFARFLDDTVPAMVARGQAVLTSYWLEDEVVGANLMLVGSDVVGGYLYGVRPDLFRRFNVTAMMMRSALGAATARGVGTFSMLRGQESYKSTWQAEARRNTRLVLGRPGRRPYADAYAAALRARRAAVTAAREHAPRVRTSVLELRAAVRNPRRAITTLRRRWSGRHG